MASKNTNVTPVVPNLLTESEGCRVPAIPQNRGHVCGQTPVDSLIRRGASVASANLDDAKFENTIEKFEEEKKMQVIGKVVNGKVTIMAATGNQVVGKVYPVQRKAQVVIEPVKECNELTGDDLVFVSLVGEWKKTEASRRRMQAMRDRLAN